MFVFSGRAHLGENKGFRPPPTRLDKHMYVIYWLRPPGPTGTAPPCCSSAWKQCLAWPRGLWMTG